jgi:hypothetical protein
MTLSRVAFERALRRLDGGDARAFVADLLGARGYRTTVERGLVVATDGPGPPVRLLVVADGRPSPSALTGHTRPVDAVVVTGGPVARAAGALAARASGREDRPAVRGPELLYEWYAFAVDDDDRRALAERYLGATEPTTLGRLWTTVVGSRPGAASVGGVPASGRLAAVLLAVLLAVAVGAAATAGPLDSFGPVDPSRSTLGDDPERTPGITSVPVPPTAAPTATATEVGATVPDVCPTPPDDAHPASLRPGVIRTASTGGLEGWHLLATQNLTEFQFDPNDQQLRAIPEVRHVAVYGTPGGGQYRLGLDRWESSEAAEAAIARGGPWTLGVAWGRYTAWTEWQSRSDEREALAHQLLESVSTPEGVRFGGSCVSVLLSGTATDGSA